MATVALFLIVIFAAMIAEAVVSVRHERALRARGAEEPPDDVYRAMAAAYPGAFLAMGAEGLWRAPLAPGVVAAGLAIFVAAKALKYWAIASLGDRWTFRVLVPPGDPRIVRGPYRRLRHPNYVAVAGELLGALVALSAWLTGVVSIAGFLLLIRRRILVEDRALAAGERTGGRTQPA